jgi:hypothetical protein
MLGGPRSARLRASHPRGARLASHAARRLPPARGRTRLPASARTLVLGLLAALLLAWPATAAAGPEINIPRAEDGPGIKAGQRSTFHPGFALVTGLDSNVFVNAKREPRPPSGEVGPRSASFIMPTAWAGLGNRQFRDGLLMTPPERTGRVADYYIGLVAGFRQYMARNPNVLRQSRLSGGLQMRVAFLPGRKFSINLDEDFFRYSQPSTYETAAYNFNRIQHKGQLSLIGRPGGGRLSLMLAGRNQFLYFEGTPEELALSSEGICTFVDNGAVFGANCNVAKANRLVNGFTTEAKWRIMPKSAIVLNYSMDWTYYTHCCAELGLGRNEDNFAHRITGGFRGQILKKVTLDAMAGYGLGFYRDDPNGPNFSSFIGDLGVTYFPNPRALFHVSLYRSFQDSLLGNYYIDAGARLQARYEFKWRMIATAGLWVAGRRYAGLAVPDLEDDSIAGYTGRGVDRFQRRDVIFNINAKLEQPLGRIWAVALSYDMAVDSTDFRVQYVNGVEDIGGFTRHVVLLMGAIRI